MRVSGFILWLVGLTAFATVIGYQGVGTVTAAVAAAGWGLLFVTLFHVVPLVADAAAWQSLFQSPKPLGFASAIRIRWIGESVNQLLPAAQIGGDFVRARLAFHCRVPGVIAGASVVADLTLGILTQILFALIGLTLLARVDGVEGTLVLAVIGICMISVLLALFYKVQKFGLFGFLTRILQFVARSREWMSLVGSAKALDDSLVNLYQRRRDVLFSCAFRMFAWLVGAGEVWLALYFLGHPITIWEAVILESLTHMIRSAAFFIPGALGVQEGGMMVLGGLIGLGPETALALSLVKRVRELTLGLPGLVAWQVSEGVRHRGQRS